MCIDKIKTSSAHPDISLFEIYLAKHGWNIVLFYLVIDFTVNAGWVFNGALFKVWIHSVKITLRGFYLKISSFCFKQTVFLIKDGANLQVKDTHFYTNPVSTFLSVLIATSASATVCQQPTSHVCWLQL